jgi:hypothetical protein
LRPTLRSNGNKGRHEVHHARLCRAYTCTTTLACEGFVMIIVDFEYTEL